MTAQRRRTLPNRSALTESTTGILANPVLFFTVWCLIAGPLLVARAMRASVTADEAAATAQATQKGQYLSIITAAPRSDQTGVGSGMPVAGRSSLQFGTCEALNVVSGVQAGAVGAVGAVRATVAPSSTFNSYVISAGMWRILTEDRALPVDGAVLIGGLIAQETGLRDGDDMQFTFTGDEGQRDTSITASVRVLPVTPDRTAPFDRAVMQLTGPEEQAESCWVEATGALPNTFAQWAPALLGVRDVRTEKLTQQASFAPPDVRIAYVIELFAVIAALFAWILLRRMARDDVIIKRISGASWGEIAVQDLCQWAIAAVLLHRDWEWKNLRLCS